MADLISVIIPVYNDPEGIRTTLNSLSEQEFKRDYEVIPVDNNSSDNTSEVINEIAKKHDVIKPAEQPKQGQYAARNRGLEEASGDIICFLDADMWVDEDYLSKVESFFDENSGVKYAGCDVEIVVPENSLIGRYNAISDFHIEEFLRRDSYAPTCCLVCRKELFDEVGFFDEELESGGDLEFGRRVRNNGFEQDFIEYITVYHPARTSLSSLRKKYARVGRGLDELDAFNPERSPDRGPFHLKNFLPAGPRGFKNLLNKGNVDVNAYEVPLFYCIHSYLKFIRSSSRAKSALKRKLNQ